MVWYVRFLGQPIDRLSPEAIVKLGVAHVPERRRVFPGLTVRENILLGGSNRVQASRRELETDAEQMFAVFPELKPFANVLGWKLSGGQQQMVAIARGLMAQPKLQSQSTIVWCHTHRLHPFGSQAYAREELRAENCELNCGIGAGDRLRFGASRCMRRPECRTHQRTTFLTIEQKKEIRHTKEVEVMRKDIPHADRTYLAVPVRRTARGENPRSALGCEEKLGTWDRKQIANNGFLVVRNNCLLGNHTQDL
jgi:hypothetical protein